MQISTILDQIDLCSIALPKFQRGFIWNREQVRSLMHSLYRRHPIGSLLVWVTTAEGAQARGDVSLPPGSVKLLLDGQQRITSLYGIIRGKPPEFFDGDPRVISGLYFNLENEEFEYYAPVKMKDNPLWINVSELMQQGAGEHIMELVSSGIPTEKIRIYAGRVNAIDQIKNIALHIEEVTGEDKDVDTVVDIFNRVNSGGTKLSTGDLALARICASWPEAREEMKARLTKWHQAGFNFKLDWLLRCINAILTGKAPFSAMKDVDATTFRNGLQQAERLIDSIINLISSRLGLDHDRVLGSRYSFPLLTRYFVQRGGRLSDSVERDKLLFWYINTFLWGRYAGSTESTLTKDLNLIEQTTGALDRLLNDLMQSGGRSSLQPEDFTGWSQGARFYPVLYMMTRVCKARDWDTDVELSRHLLGHMNLLELHHIFPKSLLRERGYLLSEVNAIANFTFLTKETNLLVSNRDPAEYLEEFMRKNPGTIESHWIPMDRELWKVENYRDFLTARRELLAKAANKFLNSLIKGEVPEEEEGPSILERKLAFVLGGIETEEEEQTIRELNGWLVQRGLPEGESPFELADPITGEPLAVIDIAWPTGLQEGYSQPVALLLNEELETGEIVNRAGYRYFTDVDSFKKYVEREIVVMGEVSS